MPRSLRDWSKPAVALSMHPAFELLLVNHGIIGAAVQAQTGGREKHTCKKTIVLPRLVSTAFRVGGGEDKLLVMMILARVGICRVSGE